MTNTELMDLAKSARLNSYSPYSRFKVGAALLCDDGEVFTGCNVENASYPAGCCAERTALFSAAAHGKRRFKKIAVTGSADDDLTSPTFPCGICLQALSEFCEDDFEVILCEGDNIKICKLTELMPMRFKL